MSHSNCCFSRRTHLQRGIVHAAGLAARARLAAQQLVKLACSPKQRSAVGMLS